MFNKKLVILFLLFISVALTNAQYDFTFTCLDDTSQAVEPGMEASFQFRLQNTGTLGDLYIIRCDAISVPLEWIVLLELDGGFASCGEVIPFGQQTLALVKLIP